MVSPGQTPVSSYVVIFLAIVFFVYRNMRPAKTHGRALVDLAYFPRSTDGALCVGNGSGSRRGHIAAASLDNCTGDTHRVGCRDPAGPRPRACHFSKTWRENGRDDRRTLNGIRSHLACGVWGAFRFTTSRAARGWRVLCDKRRFNCLCRIVHRRVALRAVREVQAAASAVGRGCGALSAIFDVQPYEDVFRGDAVVPQKRWTQPASKFSTPQIVPVPAGFFANPG